MTITTRLASVDFTNGRQLHARIRGFDANLLKDLYLFEEASGATAETEVSLSIGNHTTISAGYGSGSYSRLSGGGIELVRSAFVPAGTARNFTTPWTLFWAGSLEPPVHDTTGSGTSRYGLFGSQEFADSARGMAVGAGITFGETTGDPYFMDQRAGVNGSLGALDLLPVFPPVLIGTRYIFVCRSEFGGSPITTSVHSVNGAVMLKQSFTFDTAAAHTVSGVSDQSLNFSLGIGSVSYSGGKIRAECFGVYTRFLADHEITTMGAAVKALGTARGRLF